MKSTKYFKKKNLKMLIPKYLLYNKLFIRIKVKRNFYRTILIDVFVFKLKMLLNNNLLVKIDICLSTY